MALRNVDLNIEAGSFVVLLGRSGCGKSTLLTLLAGLTSATSGYIRYQGEKTDGAGSGILPSRARSCHGVTSCGASRCHGS